MKGWEWGNVLSVSSSSRPDAGLRNTFPICALLLSRVESRREGAREQDTEGERVSSSEVELSQLVTQVSQAGRQRGSVSGSKQVVLPLQGLITRGGAGGAVHLAAPISLAYYAIPLPPAYFGKDGQDCSLG